MFNLFKRNPHLATARALYDQAVAAARAPQFYTEWGVPDTVDGRFEMITLHVALAMRPLPLPVRQALFDVMFRDIDRSLREMGVGDLAVPKRMKRMMAAFNGRAQAYLAALASGDETALDAALTRNVYGAVPAPRPEWVAGLVAYARQYAPKNTQLCA